MTDDTTALQERIARALYARTEGSPRPWERLSEGLRQEFMADAAAVLPIVAEEVRKAKAEAWNEGFQEGYCLEPRPDWANALTNPYRATEKESDA